MISVTAMSKAIAPLWKPAERERAPGKSYPWLGRNYVAQGSSRRATGRRPAGGHGPD
jgi:hypothetical protein